MILKDLKDNTFLYDIDVIKDMRNTTDDATEVKRL